MGEVLSPPSLENMGCAGSARDGYRRMGRQRERRRERDRDAERTGRRETETGWRETQKTLRKWDRDPERGIETLVGGGDDAEALRNEVKWKRWRGGDACRCKRDETA